jgi:hypothetical protein
MFCNLKQGRILHEWGPWKEDGGGEIKSRYVNHLTGETTSSQVVGSFFDQKRQCLHCHFVQVKRTKFQP